MHVVMGLYCDGGTRPVCICENMGDAEMLLARLCKDAIVRGDDNHTDQYWIESIPFIESTKKD